jgi:hypothetical protein
MAYDIDVLYTPTTMRSIEAQRLKERIGPKPNANPHIIILCYDPDCDVVGFEIRRSNARS